MSDDFRGDHWQRHLQTSIYEAPLHRRIQCIRGSTMMYHTNWRFAQVFASMTLTQIIGASICYKCDIAHVNVTINKNS